MPRANQTGTILNYHLVLFVLAVMLILGHTFQSVAEALADGQRVDRSSTAEDHASAEGDDDDDDDAMQAYYSAPLEGSLVLSSSSIRRWALAQAQLSANLKAYLEHETFRLKVIRNNFSSCEKEIPFVEKRLSELQSIYEDLEKNQSVPINVGKNHPTSVFVSLRNFVGNWKEKFRNTTVYGKRLSEFLSINLPSRLPTQSDLELAAAAVGLLQAAYNISTSDSIQGKLLGSQGEKLNSADCYDIGNSAFRSGVLDNAYAWFSAAVKLPLKVEIFKPDSKTTFNVSDAVFKLGKIDYERNNKERGIKMMEKAIELDPENVALNQEFLKYRSGWEVRALPEHTRESMEPWRRRFFDMCQDTGRADSSRVKVQVNSRLKCHHRRSRFLPYSVYKEEQLNLSPYISTILNFSWKTEVQKIKRVALDKLKAQSPPGLPSYLVWQSRSALLRDHEADILEQLSARVRDLLGLGEFRRNKASRGEPVNVIDYGPAGLTLPHSEIMKKYKRGYMNTKTEKRLATVYLFLSKPEAGGATVFVNQNISIHPEKGMAILMYNYQLNGEPERDLLIGTCPLAVGENIVLETGIWREPLDTSLVCGRKFYSSHYNYLEKVSKNETKLNRSQALV